MSKVKQYFEFRINLRLFFKIWGMKLDKMIQVVIELWEYVKTNMLFEVRIIVVLQNKLERRERRRVDRSK